MSKKRLRNPFLLSGFYNKEYFCDRETELLKLGEYFENERNVVLYSWKRLGKTALIKHFISTLEKEKRAETIYVDLLGTRDIKTAIWYITQAVYDRFGKTESGISESLESIGGFLSARDLKVLVVIDEFQQIARYADEDGEALLHSWMRSYPGIRFIYSGSYNHTMVSMFSEKNRPFYLSAQMMQLNSIDQTLYLKFIRSHFNAGGKTLDKSVVKEIFKWSRMQTYSIQLICNKLYGQHNHVGVEDLGLVINEILDQGGALFSGYTRLLTGMQWKVLRAVAHEEPLKNPLSKDFIRKHDLGAASSVSTALNMLQRNELVIMEEGNYYIHEVLLSRWLQTL
jgi:hypothetical protein